MRHFFTFLFTLLSLFSLAQKKNKLDVVSNAEGRVVVMKALGNNSLAKDLGTFYGFGAGGQLMTPLNFGIGLDYNLLFADVKPERQNYFGNLGSQNLTNIDVNLIHKEYISEDFFLEEMIGFSYFRLKSSLFPSKEQYAEGKGGFNLGVKAVYTLDREGYQQFVLGLKGNGYFSGVNNENSTIEKYYNKSFLISLSFGYRYNF